MENAVPLLVHSLSSDESTLRRMALSKEPSGSQPDMQAGTILVYTQTANFVTSMHQITFFSFFVFAISQCYACQAAFN